MTPRRGSWGSLLVRGFLVLAGVLLPTGVLAQGISDHDYCLQFTRAERMECRAQGMQRRADCIDDFAFARWVDDSYAATDFNVCTDEAKDFLAVCLLEVTDCSTW